MSDLVCVVIKAIIEDIRAIFGGGQCAARGGRNILR